jgi:acetoacetyl-CoA synthetase
VKRDVWLVSTSGGTDIASGFVGGCPLLPVYPGELQVRCLGVKVEAFDELGRALTGEVGELVVTEPMPSMPLYFWNDEGDARYRDSYFDMYPGVWRHGDWIEFTDRGSAMIHGRSDSTLNRLGVRIGSAEIYSAVESLPEIVDSLVVGIELPDGGYYLPLFVVLSPGTVLDQALKTRIATVLRNTRSPRHVPDEIVAVADIPRTLTGKKMEVPVKKLLMGQPLERVGSVGATANPQALQEFITLADKLAALACFKSAPRTI